MISSDPLPSDGQSANGQPKSDATRVAFRAWYERLRAAWRLVQFRLRFVIVFAIAFLVVGKWDTLRAYWDRLTTFGGGDAPQAISSNTEHFCPMCPGVIADWPSKCPVCNMALVRRKKGGAVQLPNGVVSRMQYSPYRLQLAGVRTSPARYMPLARELAAYGFLKTDDTTAESDAGSLYVDVSLSHEDAAMLRRDQNVEVTAAARPGQGPWTASVEEIDFASSAQPIAATVRLVFDGANHDLSPGMEVAAQFQMPIAGVEPFRSQPTDPEPLATGEPRSVFVCPEHGDVIADAAGKCPRDGLPFVEQPLAENERLRYWCPMHPQVVARETGHKCEQCNAMPLVPRVVVYRPPGEVLAVPESAVIDTGKRHLVYVDRGEGMFEGVEVVVGQRVPGYFAIASGLEAGQKVASAGAFLLDAETRLNANTSAAYFGATTNPSSTSQRGGQAHFAPRPSRRWYPPQNERVPDGSEPTKQAEINAALSELSPEDQRLARTQRVCPVTKFPLGSMGKPERLVVEGRVVFLCCAGCEQALVKEPAKYLLEVGQAVPDAN